MSRKQPSFGGVAQLFGDDDDMGAAPAQSSGGRKKGAQPSFGGVAAMFGDDDDDAPGAQIQTKTKKAGRQASFGGVAALFGDDDDDEGPGAVSTSAPHGKKASFGGVAGLFGSSDHSDIGSKTLNAGKAKSAPAKPRGKQQSFGGVASLFGNDDSDEAPEKAEASSNIGNLFGSGPASAKQTSSNSAPPPKKSARKGKRDPSISGIESLFDAGDDDEDVARSGASGKVNEEQIHADLRAEISKFKSKAQKLENKMEQEQVKTTDLEGRIAFLEQSREELIQSKLNLIKITAMEIDRMRAVMYSMSESSQEPTKAQTVG